MKRIVFSLQMSNSPGSTWPSPSKVAATETVQPLSFGSFTTVLAFDFSGFEILAVLSSPAITTSVAVLALAFVTVTDWAGRGPAAFFDYGLAPEAATLGS